MTTHALILADRTCGEFAPVAAEILPALLPIAGKPVLQHCIEDLWEAGIRDVWLAVPPGDQVIRREIGDGTRFGLEIRYLECARHQCPSEILASLDRPAGAPILIARGDTLRGRCARAFLTQAAALHEDLVHGVDGDHYAGLALLRGDVEGVDKLDWAVLRGMAHHDDTAHVDLGGVGVTLLKGLANLYEASLGALDGRFAGLVADGRRSGRSPLMLAPRTSIARSVHASGLIRVGRGCAVHDEVELGGRVDIGDGSVIDDGAQVIDSVVLPGTYVGRGVRLENAIACGPWLYRADLDDCQRVDDPLLLSGAGELAAA
jgi:hypothetical protein